jgi:DNA-binding CsgD family transcriptional regulator
MPTSEKAMLSTDETLDQISRSGQAVFATDGGDRIVLWNRACEALLGKSARSVMGKRCYDVMCGRDDSGNVYCHRGCAVAYQARELREDPVQPFSLRVSSADGKGRRVTALLFTIPDYHPALTKIVHVLRPAEEAAALPVSTEAPAVPPTNGRSEAAGLTPREKDILRCLVEGASTNAIAGRLRIARVTVRNHIQSILRKLEAHSKLEAVVIANRLRLV